MTIERIVGIASGVVGVLGFALSWPWLATGLAVAVFGVFAILELRRRRHVLPVLAGVCLLGLGALAGGLLDGHHRPRVEAAPVSADTVRLEEIRSSWDRVRDDTFAPGSVGWELSGNPEKPGEDLAAWTMKQEYKLRQDVYGGSTSIGLPTLLNALSLSGDYYLEARLVKPIGSAETEYGLVFQSGWKDGDPHYYRFLIRNNGRYKVDLLKPPAAPVDLLAEMPAQRGLIRSPPENNTLGVLYEDRVFHFYINGSRVGQSHHPALEEGKPGIMVVAGPQERLVVELLSFVVYSKPIGVGGQRA